MFIIINSIQIVFYLLHCYMVDISYCHIVSGSPCSFDHQHLAVVQGKLVTMTSEWAI